VRSSGAPAGAGVDFGPLAARYDALRPADDNWWEVFEAIVAEAGGAGRRVLDVGCGTGRLAHALAERGADVWGVDASEEMLAQARTRDLPPGRFVLGPADELPFADGSFDAAVLRQVVHLVERPPSFVELARVLRPDGRVVIATFHPDHFEAVWVTRYFPCVAEIDRARFPAPEELVGELRAAGFRETRVRRLTQPAEIARDDALERIRGRYISTLALLDEREYREGLERAERELPDVLAYELHWVVLAASRIP
jgi:SAM-dependent methyltransferase